MTKAQTSYRIPFLLMKHEGMIIGDTAIKCQKILLRWMADLFIGARRLVEQFVYPPVINT